MLFWLVCWVDSTNENGMNNTVDENDTDNIDNYLNYDNAPIYYDSYGDIIDNNDTAHTIYIILTSHYHIRLM